MNPDAYLYYTLSLAALHNARYLKYRGLPYAMDVKIARYYARASRRVSK